MRAAPWAASLLGVLASATVFAGRPLVTEDADVLARGGCEWEGYVAGLSRHNGVGDHVQAMQVGCGIGWRTQVAVAHGRVRNADPSSRTWTVLGKTALVERSEGRTGLTLAWALNAHAVSGNGPEHDSSAAALVASRQWSGGWLTHANLGWLREAHTAADTTTWNVAVERPVGAGVELMAEAYGNDRTRSWLGSGVRWSMTDRLSVNASYAVQLDSPRSRAWTVGFKLGF